MLRTPGSRRWGLLIAALAAAILPAIRGNWADAADVAAWTLVLPVFFWAVRGLARDVWQDWAHPEIRAAREALPPPPPGAPARMRLWHWLTTAPPEPAERRVRESNPRGLPPN
jgi:hypothetical protein